MLLWESMAEQDGVFNTRPKGLVCGDYQTIEYVRLEHSIPISVLRGKADVT